jgi:sugar lactone lactonase YvrE
MDSAGNLYVADRGNFTLRKVTPAGVVSTLAGTAGAPGSADGAGTAAGFNVPAWIAVDSAGNLYVADFNNHTIRKVTPVGIVTTLAGAAGIAGSTDGTGAAARFTLPQGVAVDDAGNVYVGDTHNSAIRKITPAGVVTTLAGTAGTSGGADGTGAAARFDDPVGAALDTTGNLYVADTDNKTIRMVTPAGVVTTLAGAAGMPGAADGDGAAARFNRPYGVAVNSAGNLYVADTDNNTIRMVTPAGIVTTLVGAAGIAGSADGGAAARFNKPYEMALDTTGNLYVADGGNNTIRKVTPTGVVTTIAGAATVVGSADGTRASAQFNVPSCIALDNSGNVYVADGNNHTIRKVTPTGSVTTLAGAAGMPGSADGTGAAARFNEPQGLAMDGAGNLYVTDSGNHTVRKVTPAGGVTTLAGAAGMSGSADGTGAVARFNFPQGVASDSAGNLYIADEFNHTIRKVTPTGIVTTLAGAAGIAGSADGGSAARFNDPQDVAVDDVGNLYVADTANHTIRKVTPAGIVTTLAGAAGTKGSTDGAGAAARFNSPIGVAVDSAGNLYVADTGNGTIRRITPTGLTTTIGGVAGAIGIVLGTTPRFAAPRSLAILGDGLVIGDANAILLLDHVVQ